MAKRELQRWQETAGDREPYASGKHSYLPSFKKTIPPDAVDQSNIFLFRVYKHGTLHLQRRYGYRKRGKQRSSLHIHHWILMMFLTQHDRDTESVDRDLVFYLHKQRSCLKCRLTAKMVLNIVTLLWYSRSVPLD